MDPEQKKKCSELLEHFFRLDSTEPFRERVNWEEWGLYDYLQIVKVPMDLGTIRSKLSKNEYKKPAEFAKDMRLVWENCKRYNRDGSELYDVAEQLSKRFEDRVKSMKLDVGAAPRADKSIPAPSAEEKLYFSQNIYKISSKDLGQVVTTLEEKCPKALDKSAPDELDIVVDSIDTKTFRELEKFVLERVPEGSREPMATPKSSASSRKSSSASKRSSSSAGGSSSSKKPKAAAADAAPAGSQFRPRRQEDV